MSDSAKDLVRRGEQNSAEAKHLLHTDFDILFFATTSLHPIGNKTLNVYLKMDNLIISALDR